MAVKIDPPKREGFTGRRSEYLLDYLAELSREVEFELSLCRRLIEEQKAELSALRLELEEMNTKTEEEA